MAASVFDRVRECDANGGDQPSAVATSGQPAMPEDGRGGRWRALVAHEVSILTISGAADGQGLGWLPRSKVSMIVMGAPQHGHCLT